MHPDLFDHRSNCQILGRPQTGKSNVAIGNAMECVMRGHGTTFLDYSGPACDNLAAWCALVRPPVPVYLANLSDGKRVLPIKIFEPESEDLSAHVGRLAETILRSWGDDLRDMPTYKDTVTMVATFCGELSEPPHHGLRLLDVMEHELRVWALGQLKDRRARATLAKIMSVEKSAAMFDKYATSTASRLAVFEESKTLLRFCGLPGVVSIREVIGNNAVLLVKAAPSDTLSPIAARTYLSLLLSQFLHAAMRNAGDPIPHFLFCDEAYEWVTKDAASLLDLTVKSGLRCTFIHHHNLQFKDEALRMSIDQNAAIKYIFDGLPVSEKKRYAEEFWLMESNTPQVFETKDRLVNLYHEADYLTQTPSGDVTGTRFVPDAHWQEDNVYYTRDQQLAILAERFTGCGSHPGH